MDDDQRLRELVERGCARRGWESEKTRNTLFYTARSLMKHLGGFEALCAAELRDVRSWLDVKGRSANTVYNYQRHIRNTFDFMVEEGIIGANPAAGIRARPPSRDEMRLKPSADQEDVRRVFSYAKRRAVTVEAAKSYLVLCLKLRCGVRYSAMAKCRVEDLDLTEGGGYLLAPFVGGRPHTQVLHRIDGETAWAFRNYFAIRGPVSEGDPLIATDGKRFYRDNSLSSLVRDLFAECGLKVSDYDLGKTMITIAYAEGANVVQAATIGQPGGLTLAVKAAEELPCRDIDDLRLRLLADLDSDEGVVAGMMRAEDVMAAVVPAYNAPCLRVVIGADGWARFELPGNDDAAARNRV